MSVTVFPGQSVRPFVWYLLTMFEARGFLDDLAIVLCVGAVTTILCRRFRQPVVLGYLLAGLIVGPYIPIPLLADQDRVRMLSELGVILVMFAVGLEFSIRKMIRVMPVAGLAGLVQIGTMFWLGHLAGAILGLTPIERVFTGAILAISSTMIVAKAYAEEKVGGKLAEVVFGVLIVQDLVAVLLLAGLTTLTAGSGQAAATIISGAGQLVLFLVAMVAGGYLVVPPLMRLLARLRSQETLLVASIGICFGMAEVGRMAGYSVALGAFLAGSLIAESGHSLAVESLVRPMRDVFGAVFFVSVGMMVSPRLVLEHAGTVLLLTAVVIVGQIVSVTAGAFLAGHDVRTSVRAGMSLAQIGEFSFIIASLGVSTGAIAPFLYPVAVSVSVLTIFATPWLIRASDAVACHVDRHLPRPLQTFATLYGSWIERLRSRPADAGPRLRFRRRLRALLTDTAAIAATIIATALAHDQLSTWLHQHTAIPYWLAELGLVSAAVTLCIPLTIGLARTARALAVELAVSALPAGPKGSLDRAAAPRHVFVLALQIGIGIGVMAPAFALTQPFVPGPYGLVVLFVILGTLGIGFWKSATELQEHVQAGAEVVLDALRRRAAAVRGPGIEQLPAMLPGLGDLTMVEIAASSGAVGRTLASLDVRGLTGATVLAISRASRGIVVPTGHEALRTGDVLALTGAHESVQAARALLTTPASPTPGRPQGQ